MKPQLSRLALFLVTLVAFSPAFAQDVDPPRLGPVMEEGPIETVAGLISISGNTLSVRTCQACDLLTYQMDARTVFLIAGKQVSQSVWQAQTRGTPAVNSVVFFRLSDKYISRVVVTG